MNLGSIHCSAIYNYRWSCLGVVATGGFEREGLATGIVFPVSPPKIVFYDVYTFYPVVILTRVVPRINVVSRRLILAPHSTDSAVSALGRPHIILTTTFITTLDYVIAEDIHVSRRFERYTILYI